MPFEERSPFGEPLRQNGSKILGRSRRRDGEAVADPRELLL